MNPNRSFKPVQSLLLREREEVRIHRHVPPRDTVLSRSILRLAITTLLVIVPSIVRAQNGDAGDSNWPMYNHDPRGTRFNKQERVLSPASVARLHTEWVFPTPRAVSGTPIVVRNSIIAGDFDGNVYALRRDGSLQWTTRVAGPVSASALVHGNHVILGDLTGVIYGLDRWTGVIRWQVKPNPHPKAAVFGSPIPVGNRIAIPYATNEEMAASDPNYPCCTSRGSVVLLDPKNGHVYWQTYTVSDVELAAGAAGAGVWATPTFDEESSLIYFDTGNNYTENTTPGSDAMYALNAATGAIVWRSQVTHDDSWNFRFPPSAAHPDFDFGDSPQLYRLANGRKVVGAGQKNGFFHVFDAATGEVLNQIQAEVAGILGGLFADSAVANGIVYANGDNWPSALTANQVPPTAGDLFAIAGDGSSVLWTFSVPGSPNLSGVAVANGVVYFQSLLDGNLYAIDANSGTELVHVHTGLSYSGPSVAQGHVYVGTGDSLNAYLGARGPGSIISLGLSRDPQD
jgi:polyvinyl alcohol dehydrogenase (cytochrome)